MITEKGVIAGNIVRIVYNEAKANLSDKVGIEEITRKVSVILGQVSSESAEQARKEAAE